MVFLKILSSFHPWRNSSAVPELLCVASGPYIFLYLTNALHSSACDMTIILFSLYNLSKIICGLQFK